MSMEKAATGIEAMKWTTDLIDTLQTIAWTRHYHQRLVCTVTVSFILRLRLGTRNVHTVKGICGNFLRPYLYIYDCFMGTYS